MNIESIRNSKKAYALGVILFLISFALVLPIRELIYSEKTLSGLIIMMCSLGYLVAFPFIFNIGIEKPKK